MLFLRHTKQTSKNVADTSFKEYQTSQPENVISVNELKEAFFSLKINKTPGYDDITFNVVKKCFGVLYKPLLHIFNLSVQTGIFPDDLKLRVLLLYLKEVKIGT